MILASVEDLAKPSRPNLLHSHLPSLQTSRIKWLFAQCRAMLWLCPGNVQSTDSISRLLPFTCRDARALHPAFASQMALTFPASLMLWQVPVSFSDHYIFSSEVIYLPRGSCWSGREADQSRWSVEATDKRGPEPASNMLGTHQCNRGLLGAFQHSGTPPRNFRQHQRWQVGASAQEQATDQVQALAFKCVARSSLCCTVEMRFIGSSPRKRTVIGGRRIPHRQTAAPGVRCSILFQQQLPLLLEGLLDQPRQSKGPQQEDSLVHLSFATCSQFWTLCIHIQWQHCCHLVELTF